MRRFVSLSAFLLAVVLMLFLAPPVVSNSALTLTPIAMPHATYWLYIDGTTLYRRDMLNLVDKPVLELTQFESVLVPCHIVSNRNVTLLYVLWYECYGDRIIPPVTNGRLVEIDVQQATQRTLLEKTNVYRIHLSPDESKLAILYYEGGFARSLGHITVMTIRDGSLMEFDVTLYDGSRYNGSRVEWLDENYLIVSYTSDIFKLNTNTGSVEKVAFPDENWYISDTAIIKEKSQLVIATSLRSLENHMLRLWLYEFDTNHLTQLPFRTSGEDVAHISQLAVSPDGQYIIYNIYSRGRSYFEIGDLTTNARFAPTAISNINMLPGALFWSSDRQLLMTNTQTITFIDLTNGNLTSLDVKR